MWDCDGLSQEERSHDRKYWEAFHIWPILRPDVLKDWAGIDVSGGRIHRVIDGTDVWEEEPEVCTEYRRMRDRAYTLLHFNQPLRRLLENDFSLS